MSWLRCWTLEIYRSHESQSLAFECSTVVHELISDKLGFHETLQKKVRTLYRLPMLYSSKDRLRTNLIVNLNLRTINENALSMYCHCKLKRVDYHTSLQPVLWDIPWSSI
jgi:hypothetical protein